MFQISVPHTRLRTLPEDPSTEAEERVLPKMNGGRRCRGPRQSGPDHARHSSTSTPGAWPPPPPPRCRAQGVGPLFTRGRGRGQLPLAGRLRSWGTGAGKGQMRRKEGGGRDSANGLESTFKTKQNLFSGLNFIPSFWPENDWATPRLQPNASRTYGHQELICVCGGGGGSSSLSR